VLRGQRLDAGDAGNHLELESTAARSQDRLQDAYGAVIQRRVAPHQETAALVGRQFLVDQALEGLLLDQVQRIDAGLVVHLAALALRALGLDKAVVRIGDVAFAEFAAQVNQLVLVLALVHDEKHIDPVQRLHGLQGNVVGVAGADADDQ